MKKLLIVGVMILMSIALAKAESNPCQEIQQPVSESIGTLR